MTNKYAEVTRNDIVEDEFVDEGNLARDRLKTL